MGRVGANVSHHTSDLGGPAAPLRLPAYTAPADRHPAARSRPRRHRGCRRARFLAAVSALSLLVILGGLPLFVLPTQDAVGRPDAFVVLGPATPWKVRWAQQLIAEHPAKALVVSVTDGTDTAALCASHPTTYRLVCFTAADTTTSGESDAVESLSRRYGWHSVTVLTSTPHVLRARYLFDRCTADHVAVIGRSDGMTLGDWAWQYAYQTVAFARAFAAPSC